MRKKRDYGKKIFKIRIISNNCSVSNNNKGK